MLSIFVVDESKDKIFYGAEQDNKQKVIQWIDLRDSLIHEGYTIIIQSINLSYMCFWLINIVSLNIFDLPNRAGKLFAKN